MCLSLGHVTGTRHASQAIHPSISKRLTFEMIIYFKVCLDWSGMLNLTQWSKLGLWLSASRDGQNTY